MATAIRSELEVAIQSCRQVCPIVASSISRIERGIKLDSVGYAIGAWSFSFSTSTDTEAERRILDACNELTRVAKLNPQQSAKVWRCARVQLLALDCWRDCKNEWSASDAVGLLHDCYRELKEEVLGRIEMIDSDLASSLREEDLIARRRSDDRS